MWVKIRSNFSLVQTSGDWKLEFQSKIWNPAYLKLGLLGQVFMFGTCGLEMRILIREMESWEHWWDCPRISHIGGLSEECACTFSIFMKLGESIFSALVESGRLFLLWKFLIPIIEDMGIVSDLSWKWSCRGGRVTKRQMFFVSDEADRYFVSSPWSEALRLLLGKIFWNRVLDVINRCAEFWRNQAWRRFADSD